MARPRSAPATTRTVALRRALPELLVGARSKPAIYHASGINGQHVFVHVPSHTVVVKLSTWPIAWHEDLLKLTVRGVTAIAAALQEGRGLR